MDDISFYDSGIMHVSWVVFYCIKKSELHSMRFHSNTN